MIPWKATFAVLVAWTCLGTWATLAGAEEPPVLDVGSRLEPFVDDFLIDKMDGGARLHLHKPTRREVIFVADKPWEGNICGHFTLFHDGDHYRMYYRGQHYNVEAKQPAAHKVICYAQSKDGRHWDRPELGLVAFKGSKQNNILFDCRTGAAGNGALAVFKDPNPDCRPDARYKALALHTKGGRGLYRYVSPDGIHWSVSDKPVITEGAFDSQNLSFWDPVRKEYRAYWRYFDQGVRAIRTATSKDFLDWSEPAELRYPGAPREHLYTNAVRPYYRAPHLFIGFPTRILTQRQSLTDGLFMTSRDGETFHRWGEAIVRPGPDPDRWYNRNNYIWWGLMETEPLVSGAPPDLSIYCHEAYYRGDAVRLRRFSYRIDGFVSVRAPAAGGELLTKPLVFEGSELAMNFSTSAAGDVRVEIQAADGSALPGFALADCPEIFGDQIERVVRWKGESDLSALSGTPVRLRFVMRDADLYAIRFH